MAQEEFNLPPMQGYQPITPAIITWFAVDVHPFIDDFSSYKLLFTADFRSKSPLNR